LQRRRVRISTAAAAAVLALAAVASLAIAAEVSRDEFKAAVEPICKKNVEANGRILSGVPASSPRWRPRTGRPIAS
jgi:hypothetical protein